MSGTFTCEGLIPHLVVIFDGGRILAPVKLETTDGVRGALIEQGHRDGHRYPKPVKHRGRYVYALPGGGEVLG